MKLLLAFLYAATVRARVLLYRKGILPSGTLAHPVVSIGNLTLGGTGKTPLVHFLARLLQKGGYQPIVLSRGYRGTNRAPALLVSEGQGPLCQVWECGDEAWLTARQLEGVPVLVGRDRLRAARTLESRFERAVFLLDDGYQHLRLRRNLNLLVVDATDPFGGGRVLPLGRLREPLSALARADAILVTRAHIGEGTALLEETVRHFHPTVPLAFFYHDVTGYRDLRTGEVRKTRDFLGRKVVALSAIGNPKVFRHDLEHYQLRVVAEHRFGDHHRFRQGELDPILKALDAGEAEAIVTTEKDAVRLEPLKFGAGKIFAQQIEVRPEDPEAYAKQFLEEMRFLPAARI